MIVCWFDKFFSGSRERVGIIARTVGYRRYQNAIDRKIIEPSKSVEEPRAELNRGKSSSGQLASWIDSSYTRLLWPTVLKLA